MIILSAKDICKSYGVDVILENVSFHVNSGDRIGIVGPNGAGKSTLLKILTGEMSHDSGDFFISQDTSIGYLRQVDNFHSDKTVLEEVNSIFKFLEDMEIKMLEISEEISNTDHESEKTQELLSTYDRLQEEYRTKGGYSYKSEIKGILNSMAFTEEYYNKKIDMLSGGERTRLSLACLLLKKPNLLFLDEPTNHLDIGTLKWLEQYLKSYSGTLMIVSHDRYFLDQTVNRIFEVVHHRLDVYEGNYSQYAEKKRFKREDELRKYNAQQKEIARQEEMIRRFKQRGTEKLAKRAQSREKQLKKMDILEHPEAEKGRMKIHFKENFKSGKDVIYAENLGKSFGYGTNKTELFTGVDMDIKRGEKICILGPNGVGKTTLLKILMKELEPNEGYLKLGTNVEIAYYDQTQSMLNDDLTVMEEVHQSYRLYTESEIRGVLGRFMFKDEMVFLPVRALSGGEKARLALLKLMMSGANVLVLDEPTNHLDIESKEVFEDALMEFPGTAVIVSHDRYFLSKVPDRIMELTQKGINVYLGKYDYYQEKRAEIASGKKYLEEMGASAKIRDEEKKEKPALSSSEERRIKKEAETKRRRLEREKKALEAEIEEMELKSAEIEEEMCSEEVVFDHQKLAKLSEELTTIKDVLQKKYEKWLQYDEV